MPTPLSPRILEGRADVPAPVATTLGTEPHPPDHSHMQRVRLAAYHYPLNGDTMSHGCIMGHPLLRDRPGGTGEHEAEVAA